MKYALTVLLIVCSFSLSKAQSTTPGKLAGTYEYRAEPNYVSTLSILKNGHYTRKINDRGTVRNSAGTWKIQDNILWLSPAKKHKQEPYSLFIGEGYLKIGDIGIHEKRGKAKNRNGGPGTSFLESHRYFMLKSPV